MVETLRSLAELMIWGDQHDTRFFDFFAEKHLLSHFNRILRQPANRRGEVPQQVRLVLCGCLPRSSTLLHVSLISKSSRAASSTLLQT